MDNKKIIGITGATGSGKDTFCKYIKENYPNVFCFRFSQPLSEVLGIFFNDIKKEDQQWLAITLRERFGKEILWEAIKKKIGEIKEGIVLLNGVRYVEEYEGIKKLGGKIIYLTAESKTRWERVKIRGEKKDDDVPYEKFLEMEKAATEVLISQIGKKADMTIENNGSVEDFYAKIKATLEKI
jgi:dephospho-CoA kinase